MKNLFLTLSLLISFGALADADTAFYVGDTITLRSTENIVIPAQTIEVRTSCGILLKVDPKTRQRTFKKDREFSMKITSNTRFWTRAEVINGTTMFKKSFYQANTFEKFEELVEKCTELEVLSIEATEEEEEE